MIEERTEGVSRRTFLEGASLAAVVAATGMALTGCGSTNTTTGSSTTEAGTEGSASTDTVWTIEELGEPTETISTQVCIVGGGGTGLAAGVQAKQLGLDAVVLEKKGNTGGSFIGTEGLFAVGSHWQIAAGETVTAAEVIKECMNYHHWVPNIELYRAFFNKTAATVDWLESIGVEFDHVQALGDSHICWHIYKGSLHPGVEFMKSMAAAAVNVDLNIQPSTSGKKVLIEDGKVTGILAVKDDGSILKVEAPVVIIGCGGYANNEDMITSLSGVDASLTCAAGMDGRDGDGIKMGVDAGAALAPDPGTIMFYGPVAKTTNWGSMATACSQQPLLLVNQDAKRYVEENMPLRNFAFAGIAEKMQEKVYQIFNEALLEKLENEGALTSVGVYVIAGSPMTGLNDEIQALVDKGETAFKSDSISGLASATGLDAATLQETFDTYNTYCMTGIDEDFGKPADYLIAMEDGPFYAVECVNGYYTTCGGLKVSPNTEVLDENGEIIPGLYAGGCDTGGFYGDAYDVAIAAGSGASWAINSGRIAAAAAADYLA